MYRFYPGIVVSWHLRRPQTRFRTRFQTRSRTRFQTRFCFQHFPEPHQKLVSVFLVIFSFFPVFSCFLGFFPCFFLFFPVFLVFFPCFSSFFPVFLVFRIKMMYLVSYRFPVLAENSPQIRIFPIFRRKLASNSISFPISRWKLASNRLVFKKLVSPTPNWPYHDQPMADLVLVNFDSKNNLLQHSLLHWFKLLQGQVLLPYSSTEASGREALVNISFLKVLPKPVFLCIVSSNSGARFCCSSTLRLAAGGGRPCAGE